MTTQTLERASHALAAEVRAMCGRQGMSHAQLAERLGKNGRWVSVRISLTASVDITLDEAVEMAQALGVSAEGLIVAALRACRDSNPKPSDLVSGPGRRSVKRPLTLDRRYRSAWELAA